MRSLFFKYFFRSALLLMVSMVALSASFIMGASQVLSGTEFDRMEKAMVSVVNYLDYAVVPAEDGQIDSADSFFAWDPDAGKALGAIAAVGDIVVIICDTEGEIRLTADSSGTESTAGVFLQEDALKLCKAGEIIPPSLLPEVAYATNSALSRPLINPINNRTVGYILVSSFRDNYRTLMNDFMKNWIFMSLMVLLFSGITAYFIAQRMVSPLRQMSRCAHSFAHGDFSARVDTGELHDAETRELAFSFNAMADALQNGEDLRRGFIANISHELKTPMTTIAGFIGGLLDGTIPKDKQEQTLILVREEVMRLSRLVVSMTNLSRLQTGQLDLRPRPFDIAEMSVRVLLGFENKINSKNLSVKLDLEEDEPLFVMADTDSMIQVLTNLLDNAVKFADPDTELQMQIYSHGGKAHISIANCGSIIPPEDLPYIFDRFHKADRSRSHDRTGLGLGLFLVRSILYAHNEDIHVSSENGRTEFSFTLTEVKPKTVKNQTYSE